MIKVFWYIQYSVRKSFLERLYGFFKNEKWIFLKPQNMFYFANNWDLIQNPAGEKVTTHLTLIFPKEKKNPSINKKDFPVPVSGFSHRKKRAPFFSLVSLTTLLSLLGKKFLLLFLFFAADFSISMQISMQIFVQCFVLPKRSQL